MSHEPPALSSIPLEYLTMSPLAPALVCLALFRNKRPQEAMQLMSSVGADIFPKTPEEWDGSKRQLMQFFLEQDNDQLLSTLLKPLIDNQTQKPIESHLIRNLLIYAAKAKASKSFHWLLSQGLARRSKKVMLAAFWDGSYEIAARVKAPTPNEALLMYAGMSAEYKLLRPLCFEDIQWVINYLPDTYLPSKYCGPFISTDAPSPFIESFSKWCTGFLIAQSTNPLREEVLIQTIDFLHEKHHLHLSPKNAVELVMRLSMLGASSVIVHLIDKMGGPQVFKDHLRLLNEPYLTYNHTNTPLSPHLFGLPNHELLNLTGIYIDQQTHKVTKYHWTTNAMHYQKKYEQPIVVVPLIACVLQSQNPDLVQYMNHIGIKLPTSQEITQFKIFHRLSEPMTQKTIVFYESQCIEQQLSTSKSILPPTAASKRL